MRIDQQSNTKSETVPRKDLKSTPEVSAKGEDSKKASAEEQMAAYEDDFKESDWGHQPC